MHRLAEVFKFCVMKVQFDPNSLIDSKGNSFNGTAQVKATYFDPTEKSFMVLSLVNLKV